jgi:sarcosine oxidase subunit gamma
MPDHIPTPSGPIDGAHFSAGPGPDFNLRPADDCARFSLRIAGTHLQKAAEAFGRDIPADIGAMSSGTSRTALCLGPDEWLLMAPGAGARNIIARFADLDAIHSLVDVGHRMIGIDVSGPGASQALNAGCPLDLDALPVGGGTRTILDKAEIILMRLEKEHYRLETLRSYAEFVWNFLESAGREFDTDPGPPET